MSIEGGARAGMIAPDDTTYQYMVGLPFAPQEKPGEGFAYPLENAETLMMGQLSINR
jgi:homoaconitase/3-isopropylmalate dehydratase large subunit